LSYAPSQTELLAAPSFFGVLHNLRAPRSVDQ